MREVIFVDSDDRKVVYVNSKLTNYMIYRDGRLQNLKTGHFLKPFLSKHGYLRYSMYIKRKTVHKFVHRLIMEAFVPNPENFPDVNHKNGIKTDNRLENLEWCTKSENIQHAYDNNLISLPKGEDHHNNKYKIANIKKVIELLETGDYTRSEISDLTGVSNDTISKIKSKSVYKYLTEGLNLKFANSFVVYRTYFNSIDRAIICGTSKKKIVKTLIEKGVPKKVAKKLYRTRKKIVDTNLSIVQNTVYIDEGIEIF